MSTERIWQTISLSSDDTIRLGALLGSKFTGGEVIELASDLGGGKTTFTKGLAKGAGSKDNVASPTFTLKKIYKAPKLSIYHYDFYRLDDPGIMRDELAESMEDKSAVTVIEWSAIVKDVLPAEHIAVEFESSDTSADERQITFKYPQSFAGKMREVETAWQTSRP